MRDSQFHGHDLGVHSWKEVQEKALKSNEVTRPAEKKNDLDSKEKGLDSKEKGTLIDWSLALVSLPDSRGRIKLGVAPDELVRPLKGRDEDPFQYSDHRPHAVVLQLCSAADAAGLGAKPTGPMDQYVVKTGAPSPSAVAQSSEAMQMP